MIRIYADKHKSITIIMKIQDSQNNESRRLELEQSAPADTRAEIHALRQAKEREKDAATVTLEQAKTMLGL